MTTFNNKNIAPGSHARRGNLDHEKFLELTSAKMVFGKYKGRLLIDLPEPYVIWFAGQGFPPGKLGEMLSSVYEIKLNGLEYLFDPYRK